MNHYLIEAIFNLASEQKNRQTRQKVLAFPNPNSNCLKFMISKWNQTFALRFPIFRFSIFDNQIKWLRSIHKIEKELKSNVYKTRCKIWIDLADFVLFQFSELGAPRRWWWTRCWSAAVGAVEPVGCSLRRLSSLEVSQYCWLHRHSSFHSKSVDWRSLRRSGWVDLGGSSAVGVDSNPMWKDHVMAMDANSVCVWWIITAASQMLTTKITRPSAVKEAIVDAKGNRSRTGDCRIQTVRDYRWMTARPELNRWTKADLLLIVLEMELFWK